MNLRYPHILNMRTEGSAFSGQAWANEICNDIRVNSPKTKWLNLS